jgi:gamma-glutamyltranspeptidase / glutathione hydrolase
MVAAANPLAAEAGAKVLRAGGSAIDAAVAVQAVLGLVEPQSSGLGGGAFITYYDAATRKVTAYDGRETAPTGASPTMFLDSAGKPLNFRAAWRSGRATGAPGAVAVLALAQRDHGKLQWRDLFGEAERLGREGFIITPRLAELFDGPRAMIETPDLRAYFTHPSGVTMKAGDRLRNAAYADTVRRIAQEGPSAFYTGAIPAAIEAKVRQEPLPGTLTAADIAAYRPKTVEPLCRPYRIYVVCVPPPPSGGVGLLLGLALLERSNIDQRGPADPQAWVLLAQAQRLMYADRDRYVGDPAFVEVPVAGLLDPAYVASRAALMRPGAPTPGAGSPPGAGVRAPDATREPAGTSHFVIVDGSGNTVSMTTTVEAGFGSGRMAAGFLLNNQMTDFSFSPTERDGVPAANAVAPGKRPRSSMAPAVVLDREGRLVMAVGSPGGNAILAYNLKALVGVLDWKLSMQDAVALPNVIARGANVTGEADKLAPQILAALAAEGLAVRPGGGEGSGLHGVIVRPTGLEGGADPRREGVAITP